MRLKKLVVMLYCSFVDFFGTIFEQNKSLNF